MEENLSLRETLTQNQTNRTAKEQNYQNHQNHIQKVCASLVEECKKIKASNKEIKGFLRKYKFDMLENRVEIIAKFDQFIS